MDLTGDIYKLRLRMHQEWAKATRGRVPLVTYINSVRTSQETQYICALLPGTLTTRPQRRSKQSWQKALITEQLQSFKMGSGKFLVNNFIIWWRGLQNCCPLAAKKTDLINGKVPLSGWWIGWGVSIKWSKAVKIPLHEEGHRGSNERCFSANRNQTIWALYSSEWAI
jgi:hypothetical protein